MIKYLIVFILFLSSYSKASPAAVSIGVILSATGLTIAVTSCAISYNTLQLRKEQIDLLKLQVNQKCDCLKEVKND